MSDVQELLATGATEIAKIVAGSDNKQSSSFELVVSSELTTKPPKMNWQIRNYLQVGEIGQIFGSPESGKSLIALDIAFCVACGISWNGNEVRQTNVVYLAGEGFVGLSKRLKALELKYGMKALRLRLSKQPAALLESTNAMEVSLAIEKECKGAGLIIIDTLNRNFGGGDENSTQDMGQVIFNIDQYFKPNNESVIIVHHSGHSNKGRARGNSSLYAALDVEYKIDKSGTNITMSCTKAKDIIKPVPVSFKIRSIPLPSDELLPPDERWVDEYGEAYTAPILESSEYVESEKTTSLNHKEKMLLTALIDAIEKHGSKPTSEIRKKFGGMNLVKKVVDINYWRKMSYPYITINSEDDDPKKLKAAKLQSFNRTRDSLLKKCKIAHYDNHFWIIS